MPRTRRQVLLGGASELLLTVGVAAFAGLVVGKFEVAAVAGIGAVIAFGLLTWLNRGIAVGLLVLGIENGIPGIDTATFSFGGGGALSNALVALLIAVLLVPLLLQPNGPPPDPVLRRRLLIGGALIGGWWAITVVRTEIDGIPWLPAITSGREFAAFAILLPLAYLSLREEKLARGFLWTLAGGAVLYAVGHILTALGGANLSWLVHSIAVRSESGVARVYASMAETVHVVFALSLGAVLLHKSTRVRLIAAAVGAICLLSLLSELGRAVYLGIAVGVTLVSVYWAVHAGQGKFRRQVVRFLAVLIMVGIVATFAVPSLTNNQVVTSATSRVATGFTETSSQAGNVGVRFTLYRDMFQLVEYRLPVGLGFRDPRYHYYVDLPKGDIRNSDVGVMNAVMTMGLIGAALLYGVVGMCLGRLLAVGRRPSRSSEDGDSIAFGTAVWLVATFATSLTLVTLFSLGGLVLVATVGGVALHFTPPLAARRARASSLRREPNSALVPQASA